MQIICQVIVAGCSLPFGVERSEWDDFLEVNAIVERLRAKQQGKDPAVQLQQSLINYTSNFTNRCVQRYNYNLGCDINEVIFF